MPTKDLGYTLAKVRYEQQMESLKREKRCLHSELKKKLDHYVNLFAPVYNNPSDWFGVLYNQITFLAYKRKESPQKTVDWLFRELKDSETFMLRLQGVGK